MSGVGEVQSPRLLAGTIVVAFILAFSRWGTNIGFAPLFISDVLIAFAVFHLLATRSVKGTPAAVGGRVTPLFVAFFVYFVIRFVTSVGQSSALDWLRDGVPFAYGLLAFVSAYSLARSSDATRAATVRVLRWALTVHLGWLAIVSVSGNVEGFDVLGPIGQAPLFQVRPDIDAAFAGMAAALCLRQVLLHRRRFWNLAGLALAGFVVFGTMGTRAGQLSFLLAVAVIYAFTFAASHQAKGRQLLMVFLVPLIAVAALTIIPTTEGGQRLIATIAPTLSADASLQANAEGTQRARELTWGQVIEWTNDEPARAMFGSGFGNNFLAESGTLNYLEGTTYTNVRSPHNWFVGIYARLGIVGTILVAMWVLQLGRILWTRRVDVGSDDLAATCAATIVAILPVATLGVVLESPFGAIPFFWAAGIVMAMRLPSSAEAARPELTRAARV